ncbi:MAG: hypothetical protein HY296_08490 [Thaumarchaeota archaeon]|nr:hypothetical protein [Nitrososphaerota archaeon]
MPGIGVTIRAEDPEFRSRAVNVKVKGKEVVTPIRSLCLIQSKASEARVLNSNDGVVTMIELPREVTKTKLEEMDGDTEKQEEFFRQIRYRFTDRHLNEEITVFALTYNNRPSLEAKNRSPTPAETELLCSILDHPYNDIWVPPVVPKISGQDYLPYLKSFYEQAKTYSNVASAGLIPHIARLELRLLADFYIKEGINYFVMDFDGKNPLDLIANISEVNKMIRHIEKEYGTPCFLHALNVPFTKSHWKNLVIPAKDIVLFEMGFNCFGSSHIRRQLPKEFLEKISLLPHPHYRVFNRRDYGYYRDDAPGLKDMVVEEGKMFMSLDEFTEGLTWTEVKTLEKLFNVERHCLEATEIRRNLLTGQSLMQYIKGKALLPPKFVRQALRMAR